MVKRLEIVITDTSVLINFLCIDRIDLLGHACARCLITDHVVAEVTHHYAEQVECLTRALERKIIEQVSVTDQNELQLFAQFSNSGRLGAGECSAMAVAVNRKVALAIDDARARREALAADKDITVVGTQDLMVFLLRHKVIDVATADSIKQRWQREHSFALKVNSFADCL